MKPNDVSVQELRANKIRARRIFDEAEREVARVEVDLATARSRLNELTARMMHGAPIANELTAEANQLREFESRRHAAAKRVGLDPVSWTPTKRWIRCPT